MKDYGPSLPINPPADRRVCGPVWARVQLVSRPFSCQSRLLLYYGTHQAQWLRSGDWKWFTKRFRLMYNCAVAVISRLRSTRCWMSSAQILNCFVPANFATCRLRTPATLPTSLICIIRWSMWYDIYTYIEGVTSELRAGTCIFKYITGSSFPRASWLTCVPPFSRH